MKISCPYTSDGLINSNASVRIPGKVQEFDRNWRLATLNTIWIM